MTKIDNKNTRLMYCSNLRAARLKQRQRAEISSLTLHINVMFLF